MVEVRTLEPEEWQVWRDLRLAALADSPDAFLSTLAEESAKPDGFWQDVVSNTAAHERGNLWVAESGGEPVGMGFGRVDAEIELLTIAAMWVEASARGKGLGMALLEAMMEWARGLGAERAELWVTDGNGPAERLYERAGFSRIGTPAPLRTGSDLTTTRLVSAL